MTILFLRTNHITNVQFPKDIYKPIVSGLIAIVLLFFQKAVYERDFKNHNLRFNSAHRH